MNETNNQIQILMIYVIIYVYQKERINEDATHQSNSNKLCKLIICKLEKAFSTKMFTFLNKGKICILFKILFLLVEGYMDLDRISKL